MRDLSHLLRDSLVSMYADDPDIVDNLYKINYENINRKFITALFEIIDPKDFEMVDSFLYSDPYYNYVDAIQRASMTVTTELAQLIELAVSTNERGRLN